MRFFSLVSNAGRALVSGLLADINGLTYVGILVICEYVLIRHYV
jgi:hypothetical protein